MQSKTARFCAHQVTASLNTWRERSISYWFFRWRDFYESL
jgi:hypothetical protein